MSVPYRKLALSGGGIKGILHIGALRELAKHQPLEFPDGIYGCSVGSIIGTYLSFNLPLDDTMVELAKDYLRFDRFTPSPTFELLQSALPDKGLFSMDLFEEVVTEMFMKSGVDLRDKKIGDAKQPLYIIASNITKGVPTVFSKDVRILDAIKCSCCIPGFFKPQILYGQVYVDGGILAPCISWIQKDALTLSLMKTTVSKITPENLTDMSPAGFMRDMYSMTFNYFIKLHRSPRVVNLSYPNLRADSDLNEFDMKDILNVAGESMRSFLLANSFLEKLSEIGDSRGPNHLV